MDLIRSPLTTSAHVLCTEDPDHLSFLSNRSIEHGPDAFRPQVGFRKIFGSRVGQGVVSRDGMFFTGNGAKVRGVIRDLEGGLSMVMVAPVIEVNPYDGEPVLIEEPDAGPGYLQERSAGFRDGLEGVGEIAAS